MSEDLAEILSKQYKDIQADMSHGIRIETLHGNIYKWKVIIPGPPETPYEGGRFPLSIEFLQGFPHVPPKMSFICQMYHPNISDDGVVPLGDFEEIWKQSPNIIGLFLYIISLLSDPNCNYAENMDAALTWKTDQREFYRKVKRTIGQSHQYI